jgi:hypothetical protein
MLADTSTNPVSRTYMATGRPYYKPYRKQSYFLTEGLFLVNLLNPSRPEKRGPHLEGWSPGNCYTMLS